MLAGHGSSVEVEGSEQAGLVVSVLHLPLGSEVHAVLATDGLVPDRGNPDWQPPEGQLPVEPAPHPRTWVLLSDRHAHMEGVLREVGGWRLPAPFVLVLVLGASWASTWSCSL
jgi:hypothetical protein